MKWTKNPKTKNISFIEMEEKIFKTKENPEKKYNSLSYKIKGFDKVAEILREVVSNGVMVYVLCDYDCDGVMSGSEWDLIFKSLGHKNYIIRAPRRISEGYGMSDSIVDEILTYPMGLVVMVDNGIAAIEQTKRLSDNGWQVIVFDHHLQSPDGLPNTDVTIDPEAIPNSADFRHYCGAGLTYKFAQYLSLLPEDDILYIDAITKKKILSFASIATIADAVPLVDEELSSYDNYLIVKEGLRTILEKDGRTIGLYALLRLSGLDTSINEENYGFKIGPIINAAGRLNDDGANFAISVMTFDEYDFSQAEELANELIEMNNERKKIQREASEKISTAIGIPKYNIIITKDDDIPEGIAGLVAGDLCNSYNIPSIMLVKTKNGFYKGSARSIPDINIKEILDRHADLIYKYGGHAQAAGITILPENYEAFKKAMEEEIGPYVKKEPEIYYDYELPPSQAKDVMECLETFAPYGPGNPKPVFMIPNFEISTTNFSDGYDILGAQKNTIKLRNKFISAINFTDGVEKVNKIIESNHSRKPSELSVIGTLSKNTYYGQTNIQLIFSDVMRVNNRQ